jgi:type I restriction-modification system DNA methylase subunit
MKPQLVPIITPDAAYTQVEQLVQKFKALPAARRRDFNEAATRQAFILPLFAALGWNITDTAEVSPEEKTSRGWVDFSFRLSGIPRFFLETKKIAEDLADPRWVKQTIDYAWTKSVTWALLSDFAGLRVFNAEWKEDNPLRAQFIEFSVDTYLTDFLRLWWLSRPETAAGTLDREAEKVGKKVRKEPVSYHLFDDLKNWRHDLFKVLRAYNKRYSLAQIDEAVLRILNRLIFIRTAEDRLVEERCLLPLLHDLEEHHRMGHLPVELAKLFRQFDATYDSDLFAAHFSEDLDCEPEPFKVLIEGLYEKRGGYVRYNFNAIDADVLGTVYEQYLGQVMADSQAAEVEEKRAKRKAQGIYYTPTFVVKYIVQQTLGRYLEEQGYQPSRPLRVLDMACGSGSFLIEAFDVLDRYLARQRGQVRGEREDVIDYARRMEILSQNIYGVDKDEQAVAVARLNLLLKALHTRDKLPMLENIRCGDSLISGPPQELQAAFGKDWRDKKPFNWQAEFSEVMKGGGFDVIVGNPPYVRQAILGEAFKAYAQKKFATYAGTADLCVYFIERAMSLLKPGGILGYIVSNKWMRSNYGKALREFLAAQTTLLEIIDFGELPVFQTAATFPAIIIARKQPTQKQGFLYASIKRLDFPSLTEEVQAVGTTLYEWALQGENWTLTGGRDQSLLEKLRQIGSPLGEFVSKRIYRGVVTGCNDVFIIDRPTRDALIAKDQRSVEIIKPFVSGDEVRRYRINFQERYLVFARRGINIDEYPAIREYLKPYRDRLLPKPRDWQGEEWSGRKTGSYQWFEIQDSTDYYPEFEKPKIIYGQFQIAPHFSYTSTPLYFGSNHYMILLENPLDLLFLCGVLNSRLYFWYMGRTAGVLGDAENRGRLISQKSHIIKFPIRRINFDDPADRQRRDAIVALVTEMLQLQKDYAQAEREKEDQRHPLKRRIGEVDAAIDRLVYELYGLTEEEIKVVEQGTRS